MDYEVFKDEAFSKDSQAYMYPVSKKVVNLVLSYLEEKKGRPFELAVDAGCGTGRSTRPLAEHFCKVIGIDISESQINEARRFTPHENVIYRVSSAEKMPLEDASVDLINAELAAHWFTVDTFFPEVTRVLKNRGCLALHSFDDLIKHDEKAFDILKSQYQEIFAALPFADKQKLNEITEMYHMTLKEILDYLRATFMYHIFLAKDRAGAISFMQTLEKRMADTMGELSGKETLEFHMNFFCILACKS